MVIHVIMCFLPQFNWLSSWITSFVLSNISLFVQSSMSNIRSLNTYSCGVVCFSFWIKGWFSRLMCPLLGCMSVLSNNMPFEIILLTTEAFLLTAHSACQEICQYVIFPHLQHYSFVPLTEFYYYSQAKCPAR